MGVMGAWRGVVLWAALVAVVGVQQGPAQGAFAENAVGDEVGSDVLPRYGSSGYPELANLEFGHSFGRWLIENSFECVLRVVVTKSMREFSCG